MQRFKQADGVTSESSGDRIVILDASGETLTTLNPSGAVVWTALDEPRSLDEVVTILDQTFPDAESADLEQDGETFVQELLEAGLIVAADASG